MPVISEIVTKQSLQKIVIAIKGLLTTVAESLSYPTIKLKTKTV